MHRTVRKRVFECVSKCATVCRVRICNCLCKSLRVCNCVVECDFVSFYVSDIECHFVCACNCACLCVFVFVRACLNLDVFL